MMKRFLALDALRGLAAISVFFSHLHNAFTQHHIALDLTPLYILWAGGEAVILFFVLSGFVLTARASNGAPQTYSEFLLGRVVRIGIPNLIALTFCAVATYVSTQLDLSPPAIFPWPSENDFILLLKTSLMIPDFNSSTYNNVVWSLAHEMRFALLFPLFIILTSRFDAKFPLLIFGAISLSAATYITVMGDSSLGFKTGYSYTLYYLLIFAMGALLFFNLESLSRSFSKLSSAQRWSAVAIALLVYCYARVVYLVPLKIGWKQISIFNSFLSEILVAIASVVLMIAALTHQPLTQLLERKPLLYLGKISFSLYLVHIPCLKICLYTMSESSSVAIATTIIPIVFGVAHIFHIWVEIPAQKLGRQLINSRRRSALLTAKKYAVDGQDGTR